MSFKAFSSSDNSPSAIELRRKTLLVYFSATVGSLFLVPFGLVSLFKGRVTLTIILLTMSSAVMVLSYFCYRKQSVELSSRVIASTLMFLALFLILSGGIEGTGPYFSYSLVMLMVLLVGPAVGLAYISIFFSLLGLGLFGGFNWVYDYQAVNISRLFVSLLAICSLIYMTEWIRIKSYSAISNTSETHRQQALTDPLTGVLNRIGVEQILENWSDDDKDATLAILDLDHFKHINDSYGHDAGDSALLHFAKLLRKHIKGRDTLARWGGEEFLLLLPQTTLKEASALLEAIREIVEHRSIKTHGYRFNISVSIGLAPMATADDFEQSLRLADEHLLMAKNQGRNRIVSGDLA